MPTNPIDPTLGGSGETSQARETAGLRIVTAKFEAIDFGETNRQLAQDVQYIQETRGEFEHGGVPLNWISEVMDALDVATKKVREFEVLHTEDVVPWTSPQGEQSEIFVRDTDATGFDDMIQEVNRATDMFNDYFNRHLALIQKNLS